MSQFAIDQINNGGSEVNMNSTKCAQIFRKQSHSTKYTLNGNIQAKNNIILLTSRAGNKLERETGLSALPRDGRLTSFPQEAYFQAQGG